MRIQRIAQRKAKLCKQCCIGLPSPAAYLIAPLAFPSSHRAPKSTWTKRAAVQVLDTQQAARQRQNGTSAHRPKRGPIHAQAPCSAQQGRTEPSVDHFEVGRYRMCLQTKLSTDLHSRHSQILACTSFVGTEAHGALLSSKEVVRAMNHDEECPYHDSCAIRSRMGR